MSVLFLVAVFAVGVLSGGTAAVIGFGIGSLLTPLLVTRLEPQVAVAVVALPHLFATAVRYVRHRTAVDRRVLLRFGIPSAIGGFIGALLLRKLATPILLGVLGILLIATATANLTHGFGQWTPTRGAGVVLGLFSGLFGGLAGNQGGLRAAGLSAFALEPRVYLATSTAVALLIDLARAPVYLHRGAVPLLDLARLIGIATLGCLIGTILGERIFLGIRPERYEQVMGIAVGAVGLWLLGRAVM